MSRYRILITDNAWPEPDIERAMLAEIGAEIIRNPTGSEADSIALAPPVDAIMTTWKPVTAAVLDAAPRCRIVSRYGIGLDNIAVDRATELGIVVTNVPDYCLPEIADHVLGLLLGFARGIIRYSRETRAGGWDRTVPGPLFRLAGRTLALIGYGNTARAVVPRAQGFGLRVIAYHPRRAPGTDEHGVTLYNDLGAVLAQADYVSLHVPLTDETRALVDAGFLQQMKPTAYLLNTMRGEIVDEAALHAALAAGQIAGAGLDVMVNEPPGAEHPLLALENVVITPHAAYRSVESTQELQRRATEHVIRALAGETPPYVVNPAVVAQANYRVRTLADADK